MFFQYFQKLVVCFLILCSFAFSMHAENFNFRELNQQVADELIETNDASIIEISGEEDVYLDLERLVMTQGGILLLTDHGEYIRVPSVLSGLSGVYTRVSSTTEGVIYPRITCRNCGHKFTITIFNGGTCPKCGYQN